MSNLCTIRETAQGWAIFFADDSKTIDGQATYADAARLARRNGYTVVASLAPFQCAFLEAVLHDGLPDIKINIQSTPGVSCVAIAHFTENGPAVHFAGTKAEAVAFLQQLPG